MLRLLLGVGFGGRLSVKLQASHELGGLSESIRKLDNEFGGMEKYIALEGNLQLCLYLYFCFRIFIFQRK